jgi:hypothetical protein
MDPWILTVEIWIRIRILLFSSVVFSVPTKISFFFISLLAYYWLLRYGTYLNISVVQKF